MLHPTPAKALASHYGNRGLLAAAALACTHFAAQASEPMPRVPPEKEPAAWQLAGSAAALKDPAPMVQYHALDYCRRKQWVAQLHLPTAQWLKWLAIPDWGMQSLAAEAAVQVGAQMSAAAQRELLRLLKDENLDVLAKYAFWRSLWKLGGGMILEAQMETAAFIQKPNPDFILMQDAYDAVGGLGAAMTPATQDSLLTFIQTPGEDSLASLYATEALARAGLGMQPQMRKKMLHLLLDARTPFLLRSTAAEALGRLGAEIPPQALEFLISALRDPADRGGLRSTAATALALLGPRMPPEVQQALLAAYDETPPKNANEATRKSHLLFHQSMADVLERAGPDMPAAFQHRLVADFLKIEHATREEQPRDPFWTNEHEDPQFVDLPAIAGVRPQPDSAVIHVLLAEFQDPEAGTQTLKTIAEKFFQRLADRGALPPEVQQALLSCLQDEKAEEFVRCLAAETLGHLGASTPPAVKQALLALLQARSEPHSLYFSAVEAMSSLGPHMPPEAAPALVGILRRNTNLRKDPRAAAALYPTPDPFLTDAPPKPDAPSAAPPSASATPATEEKAPAADLEKDTWSTLDGASLEFAVHALANLGEKMTPEAQTALLGVIEYQPGNHQTPWDAAYALAQMGDKLPPPTQQRLLALLHKHARPMENALYLAIYQTLGVSGIHPVTDAQVADLLAGTYGGTPDPELRFYLYLWLGRSPEHLQAVRWLGSTRADPPLGDTPPQEILSLISRLWPHSASASADAEHAALRHTMARRTSQIITTQVKNRPQDEATRKALRTLATQLAEDAAADCVTALQHVKAALTADEKVR